MHSLLPHPKDTLVIIKVDLPLDGFDRSQVTYIVESRIRAYGAVTVLLELQGSNRDEDLPLLPDGIASLITRLAIVSEQTNSVSANRLSQNVSNQHCKIFHPSDRASALVWVQQ